MHHRTVEQLAAGDSVVHRIDPRIKLLCVLPFVVVVAVLPPEPFYVFLLPLSMVLAGLTAARLPAGFLLSRTLMVLPFVVLVAVFLPFTRGSTVVARLGEGGIAIYREGLVLCLSILIKGTLAILAIGWLVFTTRFHHLLAALRSFRVPRVIVMTVSFLFRYLDLLSDQSLRVRRARAARSPGGTTRWRWRSAGGMVGRLLLRALDRADRVYQAMVARGYDGEVRLLTTLQVRPADIWFLAGVTILIGGVIAAAWNCGMAG